MRTIEFLILQCTAGSQAWTARELQAFFMRPVAEGGRGWSRGGYHWLVEADGKAVQLYSDAVVTNGTYPYSGLGINVSNRNTVHICYTGGVGKLMEAVDNRTVAQKVALARLIKDYLAAYPNLWVLGHNQVRQKGCPAYWVPDFCRLIGVDPRRVWTGNPFDYPVPAAHSLTPTPTLPV